MFLVFDTLFVKTHFKFSHLFAVKLDNIELGILPNQFLQINKTVFNVHIDTKIRRNSLRDVEPVVV
jgi:hypothetical protein